ncbi:hypothetical protein Hanom_Chr02g00112631 [Helianthus anomalus]
MFAPDLYNIFFADKLEELKNKQAKKKNHKTTIIKENVKFEKEQIVNAHQEKSKQDESTELSQNGEVKESSALPNKTSSSEPVYSKVKPEEKIQIVEKQVKEIPAFKIEKKADDEKMSEKCLKCDKFESNNVKLLKDVESLTMENKKLKENEKDFENKIKISEHEDIFWIKLENKVLKEQQTEFKIK